MKKNLFSILWGCFCIALYLSSPLCRGALVEHGVSSYQIYIPASATAIEQKAARQLQIYIYTVTGGHPHITNTYTGKQQILVGCSVEALNLLGINQTELKRDEVIIQPVGDCLVICGEGDRGTLFAVFEYVKRELGVRFFNPREEYVPRRPATMPLELPVRGYRHVPSVGIRNIHVNTLLLNPDFAAKLHCYGVNYTKSPEWGGIGDLILGPWHTFDRFYPAEQYLSTHPEHFGLKDGKRTGGQFKGQLCLTNPSLRQVFLQKLIEEIGKAPATQVVSVSQNDNNFYCECANCTRIAREGGSQSAPVIDFVNYMAGHLEKDFPNLRLQTFAYMYSRKAPVKYLPRDNVDILLCAIEADVTKRINDSSSVSNRAFMNDLHSWQRFKNSISLWYYVAAFNNFLLPHPNYASFKNDIVFFAKQHPEFMMVECDAMNVNPITDLLILKTYLAAELMWDSAADIQQLEKDFIEKYYGAAACHVEKYLSLRERTEAEITEPVTCFTFTAEWIKPDFLFDCLDILQQARQAVSGNQVLYDRVSLLRRPFELVLITDFEKWSAHSRCPSYQEVRSIARDYLQFLKDYEVSYIGNTNSILSKQQQVERFINYPPEPCKSNPFLDAHTKDNILIFEEDAFMIWGGNDYAEIVRDPGARNSWAIRLTHREPNWAVQLPIRSEFDLNAEYEIYAACRLAQKATGGLFMFGGYDSDAAQQYISEHPDAEKTNTEEYTYVPLGKHRLHKSGYLFFDAKANPQIKHSFVDHLVFIKK